MLSRRQFVWSAAAGMLVPVTDFIVSSPVSAHIGPRGSVSSGGGGSGFVSLNLTSSVTNASSPWTFGQAFKQGDVSSGKYLTATNTSAFQADVRNLWPDGSAKFAVLSGISSLTASTQKSVSLGTTSTAPSGSNVAEPTNLANTNVVLSAGTGSYPITGGTYAINSVLGVDRSTWSYGSGGRVRQILGSVMSEFHYYQPTSDAHLALWWFVRAYSNGAVEVELVIESGWWLEASPSEKDYSVTVNVNGTAVYSGSNLQHFAHTRWGGVWWYSGGNGIVPQHDATYLRSTKLVPNYGLLTPDSNAWPSYPTSVNPGPFAQGLWALNGADSGSTGYHPQIGVLTEWDAKYATVAASQAYYACVSNSRGAGRWPTHYRDETTGRPVIYTNYSAYGIAQDNGYGGAPSAPPSYVGGSLGYDTEHHGSQGYLGYLIEGRWSFLEEIELTAAFNALCANQPTRDVSGYGAGVIACINSPLTTRGYGWTLRTVAQAASAAPTYLASSAAPSADLAVQNGLAASISQTTQWTTDRYISGALGSGAFANSIGWVGQYDQYVYDAPATLTSGSNVISVTGAGGFGIPVGATAYGTGIPSGATIASIGTNSVTLQSGENATVNGSETFYWTTNPADFWGGSWMVSFQAMAWGQAADYSVENVTSQALIDQVRNFVGLDTLQQMLSDTSWNFRRGGTYARPYLTGSSSPSAPTFYTQANAFSAYTGGNALPALTSNFGDSLKQHESNTDTDASDTSNVADGYWALHIWSLAQMVDAQMPMAEFAYGMVTGASNYSPTTISGQVYTSASDDPQFFITPRSSGLPAWLSSASTFEWISLPAPSTSPTAPSYSSGLDGDSGRSAVINAWGGATMRQIGATYMLHGGGHGDYWGNEIYGLTLTVASPAWAVIMDCTPAADLNTSSGTSPQGWNTDSPPKPVALHSYQALHYDHLSDKLFRATGQGYNGEDGIYAYTAAWPWGSTSWDAPTAHPNNPVINSGGGDPPTCGSNPLTGDIYCWMDTYRSKWTRASNTWTLVTTFESNQLAKSACAFDTRRQCLWFIGGDNAAAATVYKWLVAGDITSAVSVTDSAGICQNTNYPSAIYDPINDKVYVYIGDGSLYEFDPSALTTSTVSVSGSAPSANTAYGNTTGTNNRLQYSHALKGIVVTPAWTAPTFFMRTA